ncbi:interleukin-7-like [Python bivittatus]|uniref:Interleukin-7-like n=1 Tax=Python bivittatus TaxID=176946 RepID=A0A9F5IMM8_PYTBI|nr:interleukin-7-like [Python bivittatus]XP_025028044.1 interleukin-7-like [Python bivittatus]XP_025028045.1 interleukin-7-like [Python bivittatus]
MILPLFLVLAPEASSDFMTEIRNDYENILINIIIHLEKLLSQNSTSSCNLKNNTYHHDSFKNKTIYYLASCLSKMANCSIISSDLKSAMENVSHLTLEILKNGYTVKLHKGRCCPQCRKVSKRSDCTHTLCRVKNLVSALSSWWKKFLYHDYPQGG